MMNLSERNELRRRLRTEKTNINHIYGCYVNGAKEVVSYFDESLGMLPEEEAELYLDILKKTLSGTLGKNLVDLPFETHQVAESEEHHLLMALRESELQEEPLRERFFASLIEHIDMRGENYCILLASEAYDVPVKKKNVTEERVHEEVFRYFLCAICPVKSAGEGLRYDTDSRSFRSLPSGQYIAAPECGFLFPSFEDRRANIYDLLYYAHKPAELHQELIDGFFRISPPLSAPEQLNTFQAALETELEDRCSFQVVQSVHEQLQELVEAHREQKDAPPLRITAGEVSALLNESGIEAPLAQKVSEACEKSFGEDSFAPENMMDTKRFLVSTPSIQISTNAEGRSQIEAKVIDGRHYIMIPADDGVSINGIAVHIS